MKRQKNHYLGLLILILIIPLGIYTKHYAGPFDKYINNQLGGTIYVIFFCLAAYLFFPFKKPLYICLTVLVATIAVEFLQLWHPMFLEKIRETWIGAALLGNSFNLKDIPWYVGGAFISFFIIKYLHSHRPL